MPLIEPLGLHYTKKYSVSCSYLSTKIQQDKDTLSQAMWFVNHILSAAYSQSWRAELRTGSGLKCATAQHVLTCCPPRLKLMLETVKSSLHSTTPELINPAGS